MGPGQIPEYMLQTAPQQGNFYFVTPLMAFQYNHSFHQLNDSWHSMLHNAAVNLSNVAIKHSSPNATMITSV